MPLQTPQWTEFLLCHICLKQFGVADRQPVSLGCGHTVCSSCLSKLNRQQCPFDQTEIKTDIKELPVNYALIQLVGGSPPDSQVVDIPEICEHQADFDASRKSIEFLGLYLKPLIQSASSNGGSSNQSNSSNSNVNGLTRQMQRKLVTLVSCQLAEEEGRCRAVRAARSLGERAVKELILLHQNPQQLSTNLWTAVRLRGCQFLGPAMQDAVLKLIMLSLETGSALCRKVLVMYVVQRLEDTYSQASKTSIGHVVQLLYRASCFKVTKREGESSLLQLQDKYRTFPALRKEHDAQIVKIAMEAGLHISPEQWSSLLYGDDEHKSHMQSIIDKLQTPESFGTSIHELLIALQKTGDPSNLQQLRNYLERLAKIDPNPDGPAPTWDELEEVLDGLKIVIQGLVEFAQGHNYMKLKANSQNAQSSLAKFKTRMCRDVKLGTCPRGENCSFAHSEEELRRYRRRRTPSHSVGSNGMIRSSSSPEQGFEYPDDDSDGSGYTQRCSPASNIVATRPIVSSVDNMLPTSAPGFYVPVTGYPSAAHGMVSPTVVSAFQSDVYQKKIQDPPPGLSYSVMPAAMQQPMRQQNVMYASNHMVNYGMPPQQGFVPEPYVLHHNFVVSGDMIQQPGIYARSAVSKDASSPSVSKSSTDDSADDWGFGLSKSAIDYKKDSQWPWNNDSIWSSNKDNPLPYPASPRKENSEPVASGLFSPTWSVQPDEIKERNGLADRPSRLDSLTRTSDEWLPKEPYNLLKPDNKHDDDHFTAKTNRERPSFKPIGRDNSSPSLCPPDDETHHQSLPNSRNDDQCHGKWQLFDNHSAPPVLMPPLPYRRGVS